MMSMTRDQEEDRAYGAERDMMKCVAADDADPVRLGRPARVCLSSRCVNAGGPSPNLSASFIPDHLIVKSASSERNALHSRY